MTNYEEQYANEAHEENFQRQLDMNTDDGIIENETMLKSKMLERKKIPILQNLFDMKDILLSNLQATETNTIFLMTNQAYYLNSLGYVKIAQEYASDLEVYLAAKSAIKGGYAKLIATKSREMTRKVGDSLQP